MCRGNGVRQRVLRCLLGVAAIGLWAGSATAGLVIDARIDNAAALAAAGWTVSGDLKTATPGPAGANGVANIVVGLYAIPGLAADSGDTVQAVAGSIDQYAAGSSINLNGANSYSANVVLDNVTSATAAAFTMAGVSQPGAAHQGIGAWIGDITKDDHDQSGNYANYFLAASPAAVAVTGGQAGVEVGTATYHLGSLTPGAAGTGEKINFVPDTSADNAGASWSENGVFPDPGSINNGGPATYVAGAPVTINAPASVPEPATLVLLGTACVGLIAVWRRK